MKKLLVVAAVGVVGYYVAKKVIERKNEEVIENVEGEIVVDNDEEIEVEGTGVFNEEKEELKLADKAKIFGKKLVKAPIKLVVKTCGFICNVLTKINKGLDNMDREWCKIQPDDIINLKYHLKFYFGTFYMMVMAAIVICNRYIMLALGILCKLLNNTIK